MTQTSASSNQLADLCSGSDHHVQGETIIRSPTGSSWIHHWAADQNVDFRRTRSRTSFSSSARVSALVQTLVNIFRKESDDVNHEETINFILQPCCFTEVKRRIFLLSWFLVVCGSKTSGCLKCLTYDLQIHFTTNHSVDKILKQTRHLPEAEMTSSNVEEVSVIVDSGASSGQERDDSLTDEWRRNTQI